MAYILFYKLISKFDFRWHLLSKVRIAEEPWPRALVHAFMALVLSIAVHGSMSISFDAIVCDKHNPNKAVVTSYLSSRERPQSSTELLKNIKE